MAHRGHGQGERHDRAALRIEYRGYPAQVRIGVDDHPAATGVAEVLALQRRVAHARRHLHEGEQRVVFEHAPAVVQPGVLEIELAAGRAADDGRAKSVRLTNDGRRKLDAAVPGMKAVELLVTALAQVIKSSRAAIDETDELLTLTGLRIIYDRQGRQGSAGR